MSLKPLAAILIAAACWAQPAAQPKPLKINVLAGEGAANNISARLAAAPAVEVLDEAGKPVQGAQVTFETPRTGPTARFFGEMTKNTVTTDEKGQARVIHFTPNEESGKFQISVRAVSPDGLGTAVINQTNTPGPNRGSSASASKKKMWYTVAAIGIAAAVGGGIASSRGGNDTSTAAAKRPVSIGAGPITVGGPR